MRPYQEKIVIGSMGMIYQSPYSGKSSIALNLECSVKPLIHPNISKLYISDSKIIFFEVKNKKYFYYPNYVDPALYRYMKYDTAKKMILERMSGMLSNCLKGDQWFIKMSKWYINIIGDIDLTPYIDLCLKANCHPNQLKKTFSEIITSDSSPCNFSYNIDGDDIDFILDKMFINDICLRIRHYPLSLFKLLHFNYNITNENNIISKQST